MKFTFTFLAIGLLLISLSTFADSIRCYSSGVEIYRSEIKDLLYSSENERVIWILQKDKKAKFIFNLQCIADITDGINKLELQ
jgi:hypothetical protein